MGKMLGNTLETWEHVENPLGVWWEQIRTIKKIGFFCLLDSPPKHEPHGCMLAHLIGCKWFLCLFIFINIFGLGARARTMGHSGTT
jgi:hypothetical protein